MSLAEQKLDLQIEALEGLSRQELVEQWIRHHKCNPPKGVKQPLLVRFAAYHLQSKRLGGLKKDKRKALLAIANGGIHITKDRPQACKTRTQIRNAAIEGVAWNYASGGRAG